MMRDLRLAFRTLLKSPGFTITTIAVLALGIGANTAIFGLVNQALLRPQGMTEPERVVAVRVRYEKLNLKSIVVSVPDFRDVENGKRVFESAAVMTLEDLNYAGGDSPERLQGAVVSLHWFDVFGATPTLGRTFRPEEDQPNANNVVVLAHAAWVRLFGGDPAAVGRTILLNQKAYKIVGVMKEDFRWPRGVDAWVPMGLPAFASAEGNRFNESYMCVARTRKGVTARQADTFVHLAAARVRSGQDQGARFATDARWGMFALPLTEFAAGDTRTPMLVLMGAVAFVLLISCSNVAGLMVARTASKGREIAVRAALGASRWQLFRQAMAESAVLAAGGTLLGLLVAYGGTKTLLALAPEGAVIGLTTRMDVPVLLFTLGAAVLSALLAALAPAWQAARVAPSEQIKSGGRGTTSGRARQTLRGALVVSETALALVLLVGAGLLLKSFVRLQNVSPGFEPRGVMTASLTLPRTQYAEAAKQASFFDAVTERLAAVPGVSVAAVVRPMPFGGSQASSSFGIEGRPAGPGDPGPHSDIRYVTPSYFSALSIPLRKGRVFTPQDRADVQPVTVIDENLARQYWPGEDPVGKRIRRGTAGPWVTIVGVVGHVKHSELADDSGKGVCYYSLFQRPVPAASIVVRSSLPPASSADAIRRAIAEVDPALPLHDLKSMEDLVAASLAPRRFTMQLLALFAAIALSMAALGLYGVISYSVSQRIPEIGVRLALGAQRRAVLWLVVGNGLRLAAVGMVLGLAVTWLSSGVLKSQLYGVEPFDPATFAVMVTMLFGTALAASYVPARRATRVDPLSALRSE